MDLSHLGLKLGGCNDEVAALQSDHYTEVTLYMHGTLSYMQKWCCCENM